jgi:hypothetical protein
MIPYGLMEPSQDEHGGLWKFYRGQVGDREYAYTLQLPPEIHNYIIERYVGTEEQGPLPADFRFTSAMLEDIRQQWEAREGERPADLTVFRAAVEETVHHRYYRQDPGEIDLETIAEQRERVLYDPLPEHLESGEHAEGFSFSYDEALEAPAELIEVAVVTDDPQPPSEDFVCQDLLEHAPLNFRDTVDPQLQSLTAYLHDVGEHSTSLDIER